MNKALIACLLAAACLPAASDAATYVDIPLSNVRDHTFTSDGYLMVTSGNRIVRYDLLSCTMQDLLIANSQLLGVSVSPDDEYIAAAVSGLISGQSSFYYKKRYGMRGFPRRAYAPSFGESGSFMPSWTQDSRLLITGTFAGSGWVPMREFQPNDGTLSVRASVTQNSMLAQTGTNLTAIAEASISSGPLHAWDNKAHQMVATANTGWFVFEVGVNNKGTRYAVPTYNGTYVYDLVGNAFLQVGLIGQYANHVPVAAVFSPDGAKLITADWSWNTPALRGIKLLDATTLQLLASLDSYAFPWVGNQALGEGRLSISADSHFLAATISSGVRLYDVSQELTGQYLGGCANQVPATDSTGLPETGSPSDKFDAWGWPLSTPK